MTDHDEPTVSANHNNDESPRDPSLRESLEHASPSAPSEGVDRRSALKTLAVGLSLPVLGSIPSDADAQAKPAAGTPAPAQPVRRVSGPRGTASDPDLLRPKKDWPRKLMASELATIAALCDVIIPADDKSPSASAVGAPAYINEHVSAPLENNMRDLVRVRGGVAWLNQESTRRFSRPFTRLTTAEKTQICDDICYIPNAKPEFRQGARFFSLIRNLTATAFYTTEAGMKDIGYIGNMALPKWDPPPAAVLKHLGLE